MRVGLADAAPIEVAVERKDDAMGIASKPSRVTTPACCKSRSEYPILIKPGAQAAAGRIADAHVLDQLRLAYAALMQVDNRFRMPV